ncbi:hypothetical protein FHX14_005517 [Rhizobium sp. BK619]|uniref:hypothetical protein n=1 Tax=Rhizobium sp. BK619 TaxID=2586989 RepID=UPI00161E22DB|nr:hypothetical protein [Rhizobium sp. BK619]MBB3649283.1 hypothetical protein [Rhizobium sp. BK619]
MKEITFLFGQLFHFTSMRLVMPDFSEVQQSIPSHCNVTRDIEARSSHAEGRLERSSSTKACIDAALAVGGKNARRKVKLLKWTARSHFMPLGVGQPKNPTRFTAGLTAAGIPSCSSSAGISLGYVISRKSFTFRPAGRLCPIMYGSNG